MIGLLLIVGMGVLARMAGGGVGASYLAALQYTLPTIKILGRKVGGWVIHFKWLPEMLFAVPFGLTVAADQGAAWGAVGLVWSFLFMQTGHGVVLPWGGKLDPKYADRKQTLSPFVDWLADRMGIVKTLPDGWSRTVAYCRLFMAVKGLLIALPLTPAFFAAPLLLAVLWPLGYEIGARLRGTLKKETAHALAEFLTGVFAGVVLVITWKVF